MIKKRFDTFENSACFCQFADREITLPQWVDLFNTVAGYDGDIRTMLRAGRRVFYLKRLLNFRYGRTAADDTLPPRMLEPARDGEPEGVEMNFEEMKKAFYDLMGLDAEKGIPGREVLDAYGMSTEAEVVWMKA